MPMQRRRQLPQPHAWFSSHKENNATTTFSSSSLQGITITKRSSSSSSSFWMMGFGWTIIFFLLLWCWWLLALLLSSSSMNMNNNSNNDTTTTIMPLSHFSVMYQLLLQNFRLDDSYFSKSHHDALPPPPPWVVFYHIYVPPHKGKRGMDKALEIVQEQLHQIGQQALVTRTTTGRWEVYYTTTGAANVVQTSWMEKQCHFNYLHCQHLGHWTTGNEDITLNRIYDYCLQQHDDKRNSTAVIYLHSKGTYHSDKGRNDVWRRALTHAVTHPDCLHAVTTTPSRHTNGTATTTTTKPPPCDVCGLLFSPLWTTFFPGNSWTAQCSYVKQLLPLSNFSVALQQAVLDTHLVVASNDNNNETTTTQAGAGRATATTDVSTTAKTTSSFSWQANLFRASNPGNVGLGRYAAEHWIGSHPRARFCDLGGSSNVYLPDYMKTTTTRTAAATNSASPVVSSSVPALNWSMAPYQSIQAHWYRWNASILASLDDNAKSHEYFLLPGFLFRWHRIYGIYPHSDSWVWDWYPDGSRWKQAILDHQNNPRGHPSDAGVDAALYRPWWLETNQDEK